MSAYAAVGNYVAVSSGGYVGWNFFTDATVRVGNDIQVRNGTLTSAH